MFTSKAVWITVLTVVRTGLGERERERVVVRERERVVDAAGVGG